jgi:glutamate racemase
MGVKDSPIGVFDSGIGGLTVMRALIKVLPYESIIYFGDTARVPYGTKSPATIVRFSLESVEFLLERDVKCVVVACNTSSAHALPVLRKYFKVPIIGVIQPGAMAAVKATKNKRVGIIGTQATVRSKAYEEAIKHLDPAVRVVSQSCPLFVPLAEEGMTRGKECESIIQHYCKSLKRSAIDTLILGCTHYPLLAATIQKILGRSIHLIDSGRQTAVDVQGLLMGMDMLCDKRSKPSYRFYVTDENEHFQTLSSRFLGRVVNKVELAKWNR